MLTLEKVIDSLAGLRSSLPCLISLNIEAYTKENGEVSLSMEWVEEPISTAKADIRLEGRAVFTLK